MTSEPNREELVLSLSQFKESILDTWTSEGMKSEHLDGHRTAMSLIVTWGDMTDIVAEAIRTMTET